jgi:hypothetical protein
VRRERFLSDHLKLMDKVEQCPAEFVEDIQGLC